MKKLNNKSLKIGNWQLKIPAKQVGFTLIELLVVVAIIGVLSALLMSNFVGIRQRARDGQRKSDLRQIQSALELYRADQGAYPTTDAFVVNGYIKCNPIPQALSYGSTIYMKAIPCDPLSSTTSYQYTTNTSNNYCLRACLENTNDSQIDAINDTGSGTNVSGCSFIANVCSGSSFRSYTLQNP